MADRYDLEARQLMRSLVAVEDIGIEAAVKLIAEAMREGAAAAYDKASEYHQDIADSKFCAPDYRRIHRRDSDRFKAKAASLRGKSEEKTHG